MALEIRPQSIAQDDGLLFAFPEVYIGPGPPTLGFEKLRIRAKPGENATIVLAADADKATQLRFDLGGDDAVTFSVAGGPGTGNFSIASSAPGRALFYGDWITGHIGFRTASPLAHVHIFKDQNLFNITGSTTGPTGDALLIQSIFAGVDDEYVGSIGFSRTISGGIARGSAIAEVQTSADANQKGLAFFTHPTTNEDSAIVEGMRLEHDGKVGIGTKKPLTLLTLEGVMTLKEQAVAPTGIGADYGQMWVKSDAPNILMFTDDVGADFTVDVTAV